MKASMQEQKRRTAIRSITYRLGATIILSTIGWLYTGDVFQTSIISVTFSISSSVFYYVHERVWFKINWGMN
jgi:uncharacterized membrane protein